MSAKFLSLFFLIAQASLFSPKIAEQFVPGPTPGAGKHILYVLHLQLCIFIHMISIHLQYSHMSALIIIIIPNSSVIQPLK